MKSSKLSRALPALALSVLLVLSLLSGCNGTTPPDADDGGEAVIGTPTLPPEDEGPDPGQLATDALEKARDDIGAWLDASPLSTLANIFGGDAAAADFSISLPDEEGNVASTFTGSLTVDMKADSALMDGTMTFSGSEDGDGIPLKLWYSPDFLGLSSQLFGNDTFYGLAPHDMASQLEGTDFAELFSLDLNSVAEMDEYLETIPSGLSIYRAGFLDGAASTLEGLLKDRELQLEEAPFEYGGREMNGYKITAHLSSEETADLIEDFATMLPQAALRCGVPSVDENVLTLGDELDAMRGDTESSRIVFSVAEEKLYHISLDMARPSDINRVELGLYGDNGSTINLFIPQLLSFKLDFSDGVSMDASTMSVYPVTTTLRWGADGSFDFITYSTDITDLCLEGAVTASEGSLSYEGIWYSGERGDRNPLSFTLTPGGTVTAPTEEKNVGKLTKSELSALAMKLILGLGQK